MQLGIRQPLTVADLPREDEEGFVFWVDKKDDLNDIETAADPLVLPYRVLLLTPGQALTLDQHSGYKTPRRLTSSEDIAFVRRAVERNREIVNIPVPSDVLPEEVQSCHLRFHVRGEVPAWGVGRDGVPTYVRGPKQSRYLKRIPVSFPYVSMVMECSKEMDDEGERMLLSGFCSTRYGACFLKPRVRAVQNWPLLCLQCTVIHILFGRARALD